MVAHYVTEAAAEMTGVGKWRYTSATLTRWVSSIDQFHTAAGYDAPGRSEVVRRALSGVRRIRSTPPVRRASLLLDDIRTLITLIGESTGSWPSGVGARRDIAVLLMGFAGASRRSELVALTVADVTLHATDGVHVRIRHSKTDQGIPRPGEGTALRRDPVICPPRAYVRWRQLLRAWDNAPDGEGRRAVMTVLRRQAAAATTGEATHPRRSIAAAARTSRTRPTRNGHCSPEYATGAIGGEGMTGHAVNRMIRRRAEQAGFTPAQISCSAGVTVTEAFRAGADAHAVMRQTGHRSPGMLEVYAREHAALMGNAVTRIGL